MGEIKLKIASVVIGSGEGGGGVEPYYTDLPDKPSINGETLAGNMTSEDLGLASESQAVPSGGTTGQVLAKKSNADNDVQWVNQEESGTDDYTDLTNKPQINSVALSGNKTASDLGLATAAQGALAASAYQKPQTGIPSTDLASGVQNSLGKADTAVQQVTVGTTTTGAAGTNASVTNSGTSTAPVLDFTIPRGADGADAVNPFKGWYTSSSNLPSNPVVGDYAYVKGASSTDPAAIYECTTDGSWSDSGRTADTSNVQTFESSEEVNETYIDDTHLINPKSGALAKAEDVKAVVADDDVSDLDIADNNGKVIMRLANGEVATKNFNSAATPSIGNTIISVLDIADSQGNVVMRIDSLGNILTFGFDSTKVVLKDAVNSVSDSIAAFVGKMNEYAANFGMTNTHFLNASGQNQTGHYSTAKDIMRMCACCTAYEKLMRYWGLETFTFHVVGANARDISVASSYKGSVMESVGDYYHIYGGKSGTWVVGGSIGTVRNLTLVVKSNADDAWLVGCVIKTSDTDRGIAFKQLIDWLEAYRQDPTTQQPTINAAYAAAGIIQPHNPMAYADVDYCLVSKSGDTQYLPASMTKLMTSMVVLDYCSLDETLTIIASDIQSGSGSTFYAGDQISIADAIPAMLLPSSNTLAVALSRYVGNKIINIKNK